MHSISCIHILGTKTQPNPTPVDCLVTSDANTTANWRGEDTVDSRNKFSSIFHYDSNIFVGIWATKFDLMMMMMAMVMMMKMQVMKSCISIKGWKEQMVLMPTLRLKSPIILTTVKCWWVWHSHYNNNINFIFTGILKKLASYFHR